jgi:FKBP-type peptidyl-prolyl cis-trans isomerase (trigger factor)
LVINFLHTLIQQKKILVAGSPRLSTITFTPSHDAHFTFEFSLFAPISFQDWKYLPFKAPKRKNYKDLDRQVESFIQEEIEAKQAYTDNGINIGDWINFSIALLNEDKNPILYGHTANFWFKLGDEEPDRPSQELFLHKKNGETFCTNHPIIQDYFSNELKTNYHFGITVLDIIPHAYFCFDKFKQHFRIKSNKEMYQKLIEVFSYRNDLSLRRTMVEESFKLLFSKHKFEIPNHLILRQQKQVLIDVQNNPDYHVYRVQKDFKEVVRELAEKQIREEIFIDQLAHEEEIQVTSQDIKNYLNFSKRARMLEFLYFRPPQTKINSQEYPILTTELIPICLREKMINHMIHQLTKK